MTLLDIGGGVGDIQHELLRSGVSHATDCEVSTAYLEACRQEAERLRHADHIDHIRGDFIALAKDIPPASAKIYRWTAFGGTPTAKRSGLRHGLLKPEGQGAGSPLNEDSRPKDLMMNTSHVIARSTAASTDQGFLEARLYEHNRAKTEQDDGQLFAFVVRNELQEIVAGISGWTWAHACEIRDLWVHPMLRGQGYGERLLAAAEQEARHHGCTVILLASYSFQAPEFYQKHGYELAWQLKDFPPGHQYCYLVKRFASAASG